MLRIVIIIALLVGSTFAAAAESLRSEVNGSIVVEAGESAGSLETMNGSIQVGNAARIAKAATLNGSINLGSDVEAQAVSTINGSIDIGSRTRVGRAVDTVNGRIAIADAADVSGNVENVTGTIRIAKAHVAGRLQTTSGDIEVGADARVDGGIIVEKPGTSMEVSGKTRIVIENGERSSRTPRIVIGPGAIIGGTLDFRREVELHVSDSAVIGPVTGAVAKRFSGAAP